MEHSKIVLAFLLETLGFGIYLYFTPNTFIPSVDAYLHLGLPNPLGNFWAFAYGIFPATFATLFTLLVAQGSHP